MKTSLGQYPAIPMDCGPNGRLIQLRTSTDYTIPLHFVGRDQCKEQQSLTPPPCFGWEGMSGDESNYIMKCFVKPAQLTDRTNTNIDRNNPVQQLQVATERSLKLRSETHSFQLDGVDCIYRGFRGGVATFDKLQLGLLRHHEDDQFAFHCKLQFELLRKDRLDQVITAVSMNVTAHAWIGKSLLPPRIDCISHPQIILGQHVTSAMISGKRIVGPCKILISDLELQSVLNKAATVITGINMPVEYSPTVKRVRVLCLNGYSNEIEVHYIAPPSQIPFSTTNKRCVEEARISLHSNFSFEYTFSILGLFNQSQNGETALHFAAAYGTVENVRTLLSDGAFLEATNRRGATPLFYAVATKNADVIKFLLASGASTTVTTEYCLTPLKIAAFLEYDLPAYCELYHQDQLSI